jgi:5'-methylthioinosine phosphorylase
MDLPAVDLAIIGGTGVYQLSPLEGASTVQPETPFGAISSPICVGHWGKRKVAFLARHGADHGLLPHRINYRANLWALDQIKASQILAINAVGSLDSDMPPAGLVLPDQLIDYTWGREHSFAGELPAVSQHIDFSQPFCAEMRASLIQADGGELAAQAATLGVTQGPRLETAAEIRRLGVDGCHLVGMTSLPEAALARELNRSYASLCVVANWAAGFDSEQAQISMDEVQENVSVGLKGVMQILNRWLTL